MLLIVQSISKNTFIIHIYSSHLTPRNLWCLAMLCFTWTILNIKHTWSLPFWSHSKRIQFGVMDYERESETHEMLWSHNAEELQNSCCSGFHLFINLSHYLLGTAPWWRHDMETLSTLLALLRGIHGSPVDSLHKRPVMCSYGGLFHWPIYVSQGPLLLTHYNDVIIGAIASQITSLTIAYSTIYSGADQRKHQSSASLAFVPGIHRSPMNSPHKWPVTRKMLPFDDAIMNFDPSMDK